MDSCGNQPSGRFGKRIPGRIRCDQLDKIRRPNGATWLCADVDVPVACSAAGVSNHSTGIRPMDRAPRLKRCVTSRTEDRGTLPQRPADAVDFLGCIWRAVTKSAIGARSGAPQVADAGNSLRSTHTFLVSNPLLHPQPCIHRESGFALEATMFVMALMTVLMLSAYCAALPTTRVFRTSTTGLHR